MMIPASTILHPHLHPSPSDRGARPAGSCRAQRCWSKAEEALVEETEAELAPMKLALGEQARVPDPSHEPQEQASVTVRLRPEPSWAEGRTRRRRVAGADERTPTRRPRPATRPMSCNPASSFSPNRNREIRNLSQVTSFDGRSLPSRAIYFLLAAGTDAGSAPVTRANVAR